MTLCHTHGNVEALALGKTLVATLPDSETETFGNALVDMEAKTLDDNLAFTLIETRANKLGHLIREAEVQTLDDMPCGAHGAGPHSLKHANRSE